MRWCSLFRHTSLAELIAGELIKVRHTTVARQDLSPEYFGHRQRVRLWARLLIRLDAVMSVAFQSSRSRYPD